MSTFQLCSVCDDRHPALYTCVECNEYYCEVMARAHKKMCLGINHHVIEIPTSAGPTECIRGNTNHFCKDHDQVLEFYCLTCENEEIDEYELLCSHCLIHDDGHKGHDVVTLDRARKRIHVKAKDQLTLIRRMFNVLKKRVSSISSRENQVAAAYARIQRDIKAEFAEISEILKAKETDLLFQALLYERSRVQRLSVEKRDFFSQSTRFQSTIDSIQNTIVKLPENVGIVNQRYAVDQLQKSITRFKGEANAASVFLNDKGTFDWEPCVGYSYVLEKVTEFKESLTRGLLQELVVTENFPYGPKCIVCEEEFPKIFDSSERSMHITAKDYQGLPVLSSNGLSFQLRWNLAESNNEFVYFDCRNEFKGNGEFVVHYKFPTDSFHIAVEHVLELLINEEDVIRSYLVVLEDENMLRYRKHPKVVKKVLQEAVGNTNGIRSYFHILECDD